METQGFPTCCGAQIYKGFGNTDTAIDRRNYSEAEILRFLDQQETYSRAGRIGMVTCILNNQQMTVIGKAFKKRKWRVVYHAYHPNHDTTLYLLAKKLFKTPTKEKNRAIANFNKK